MRRFFFFFLLLTVIVHAHAAHLKGGWVKYVYVGPTPGDATKSRYNITVHQYLSCNSNTTTQVDANIYLGVYTGGSRINTVTIPRDLTASQIASKSDFPCVTPAQEVCYRIDVYNTTLDLPNTTAGYTLAVQRCSRVAGIINVANSGNTGITYTTNIPGQVTGITNAYQNSSASFTLQDANVVCANNSFSFPFVATDPDSDSLAYSFTSGYDIQFCDQNNPIINPPLGPPYPNVIYQGAFSAAQPLGTAVTINAQTGIISGIAPATTGDYVVAVLVSEFRNGIKIADNRKELHVTVSGCNIPTADLPIRPTTCDGFTVNFQNNSTSAAINSYNWDFGVNGTTADVSTQATPTYTYADTGTYTVTLTVNAGEPCSNTGTQIVRVYPGFFPGFTVNGSCKGVPFQFTDTTRTNYGFVNSWSWNFGDQATLADTSHVQNPTYTYPNFGTNTVSLIVTNSKGCIDTATTTVTVNDKPDLRLTFRDTLICATDTLQLQAISGTGQGSFSWTPNYNISSTTIGNPLVSPLTNTTYSVTLNDRGCVTTENVNVNVIDFVTLDAGKDTTICLTDTVILTPLSNALRYVWTPAATLSNANVKNPLATPTAAATLYYVTGSVGKCSAVDSVLVKTIPYPTVSAGNDTTICFAGTATLHGTTNAASFSWAPARLISNATTLQPTVRPTTTTSFVLTVIDTLGCPKPSRDTVVVTVRTQPLVFAGNDTTIIIGQPLILQPTVSSFLTNYLWTPSTGMDTATKLSPTITITRGLMPASGQITYRLTATSSEGCSASDEVIVKIFTTPPSVFVPSAFTPNSDGKNDVIRPVLAGIRQLNYFNVYNRPGQLVFSTKTAGQGWDGNVGGNPQGSAAFVYTLEAVDYLGKVIKQSGTFVLIR